MTSLIDRACQMLEPGEREVVRGDIAESGETWGQALRDVLGLVARRQAALWKDWRPWLALVGLGLPLGILLALVSRRVADATAVPIWMYVNNWEAVHLTNAGFRSDLIRYLGAISIKYVMLACWAWATGFLLASLARRTVRAHGVLFCFVLLLAGISGVLLDRHSGHAAVFALAFYSTLFPLIVETALVLFPSMWGMHQGVRVARLSLPRQVILQVGAATILAMLVSLRQDWWNLLLVIVV